MNIWLNGEQCEVVAGLTVGGLLAQMQLPTRGVAVEVNLDVIPRAQHDTHELREGDRLEIVTLVGGG